MAAREPENPVRLPYLVFPCDLIPADHRSVPSPLAIVTPKQYKNRFRSAMNRYFQLVPDIWMSKTSLKDLGEELSAFDGGEAAGETGKTLVEEDK